MPETMTDDKMSSISFDEIVAFKRCRRRWLLEYVEGREPERSQSHDVPQLDKRIIDSVNDFYLDDQPPIETYARLTQEDRQSLWKTHQDTTRFDYHAEVGRVTVSGYVNWLLETDADEGFDFLTPDVTEHVYLFDGLVDVKFHLPPLIRRRDDDVVLAFVHQPVDSLSRFSRVAHISEVTRFLGAATSREHIQTFDGVLYNTLLKNDRTDPDLRPPFYSRVESRFTPESKKAYWLQLQGVVRDLIHVKNELQEGTNQHVVAYPSSEDECAVGCKFYSVCSTVDDGFHVAPTNV